MSLVFYTRNLESIFSHTQKTIIDYFPYEPFDTRTRNWNFYQFIDDVLVQKKLNLVQ